MSKAIVKRGREAPASSAPVVGDLLADVRRLIEEARRQTVVAVNAELTFLYWRIGDRIRREVLKGRRADYGELILATLSQELTREYGQGFAEKNLRHMIRFAEVFPDDEIVSALRRQLSWTHFRAIIYLYDPLKRDFYAEMCRLQRWSTRTLDRQIDSMLYERTALSRKPEAVVEAQIEELRRQDAVRPTPRIHVSSRGTYVQSPSFRR